MIYVGIDISKNKQDCFITNIFDTLFTTLQNVSIIGRNLLVHIWKRSVLKVNMLLYAISHKNTCKNYFCNGKIRTGIQSNHLIISANIFFLEHLQRCSYCHAVFKVLIAMKSHCHFSMKFCFYTWLSLIVSLIWQRQDGWVLQTDDYEKRRFNYIQWDFCR